jgi:S-adenosylmethionine:tRNA ribosyltransferase-isomerase
MDLNDLTHEPNQGNLTLKDFDFRVPADLIAHLPLATRDESKLLIYKSPDQYQQGHIKDLLNILPKGSVLILNNSKVFPSRLMGSLSTGGKVEVFLTKEAHQSKVVTETSEPSQACWWALGRPLKKLRPGRIIHFDPFYASPTTSGNEGPQSTLTATVLKRDGDEVLLAFNLSPEQFNQWTDEWGMIPLPPYISRDHPQPACLSPDKERYQTVFALERGSVAAPTAGLHFSPELLKALESKEIHIRYVSLHVGAGTFLPVKSDRYQDHAMHSESYLVPRATVQSIIDAKNKGLPVIAVGTTSFRCLEDLYRRSQERPDQLLAHTDTWHETAIYLYPKHRLDRYTPWVIDGLITNFHQPQSTLFMLICLLMGFDQAHSFYRYSFANAYRLFSYGDASFIWLRRPLDAKKSETL